MNKQFIQVVGILAIAYVVLKLGLWSLHQATYALGNFAYWLRWDGIPSLFTAAIVCGVVYFLWQMLFGKD